MKKVSSWYYLQGKEFIQDLLRNYRKIPGGLRIIILIFVSVTIILIFVSVQRGFYDDEGTWIEGVLTEAHGMWFDILVLGVIATVLNLANESKQKIERYNEEIEDFLGWHDEEAKYRIAGNIRRINQLKATPLNLSGAYLKNVSLNEADLNHANLEKSLLEGAELQRAKLSYANFTRARMAGVRLREADLRKVNFHFAKLRSANFFKANLDSSNFWFAELENACFEQANLKRTNFRGAKAKGASFLKADLSEADLSHADFTDANFTGANLEGIRWHEETIWPDAEAIIYAKNIPEELKEKFEQP